MSCRHKPVFVLLALLVTVHGPARAADLNAPAEKRVTIGSELARGRNAAASCVARAEFWDDLDKCIGAVAQSENRRNTDTNAFRLALLATALVKLTEFESRALSKGNTVGTLLILTGKEWHANVELIQRTIKVPDQQLAEFADSPVGRLKAIKQHWAERPAP